LTCGFPSERGAVATSEAFAPLPTVGLPLARSGGQALAHAPKQALFGTRVLLEQVERAALRVDEDIPQAVIRDADRRVPSLASSVASSSARAAAAAATAATLSAVSDTRPHCEEGR